MPQTIKIRFTPSETTSILRWNNSSYSVRREDRSGRLMCEDFYSTFKATISAFNARCLPA